MCCVVPQIKTYADVARCVPVFRLVICDLLFLILRYANSIAPVFGTMQFAYLKIENNKAQITKRNTFAFEDIVLLRACVDENLCC